MDRYVWKPEIPSLGSSDRDFPREHLGFLSNWKLQIVAPRGNSRVLCNNNRRGAVVGTETILARPFQPRSSYICGRSPLDFRDAYTGVSNSHCLTSAIAFCADRSIVEATKKEHHSLTQNEDRNAFLTDIE